MLSFILGFVRAEAYRMDFVVSLSAAVYRNIFKAAMQARSRHQAVSLIPGHGAHRRTMDDRNVLLNTWY
jgi:hypothetical protein